jgi:hypothetical protein
MIRIQDLESGLVVDVAVREIAIEGFCEQLRRGARKPKNRAAFVKRLEYRIELALEDSLDFSLQPPRTREETRAVMTAMMRGDQIPEETFRRRTAVLKYLRESSSGPQDSELATNSTIPEPQAFNKD